jgi:hypothetical protein
MIYGGRRNFLQIVDYNCIVRYYDRTIECDDRLKPNGRSPLQFWSYRLPLTSYIERCHDRPAQNPPWRSKSCGIILNFFLNYRSQPPRSGADFLLGLARFSVSPILITHIHLASERYPRETFRSSFSFLRYARAVSAFQFEGN